MKCSVWRDAKNKTRGACAPRCRLARRFFGAGDAAACAGYAFLTPPRWSTLSGALCLSV